jgi:hypothetical protein
LEKINRLDFLKRKNAGKRLLPGLKEKLAHALEVPVKIVHFLPLEESDRIRERASLSFAPRNEIEGRKHEYAFLSKRVPSEVSSKDLFFPQSSDVFVILPDADKIGVLRLPAKIANSGWKDLLWAQPDGFILIDPIFANKFVIQVEKDGVTGQHVFDVAAWGPQWSNALQDWPA